MRFSVFILSRGFLLAALSSPGLLRAQSSPDCPVHPATLTAMRHCYRPLLVFAPSVNDPRLARQQASLDKAADDMMDRNVLYLPVIPGPAGFSAPLDAPYALLPRSEIETARRRFHVAPDAFAVVLLGEDGGEKLRSSLPVSIEKLNSLIDGMPMRKLEIQRPHTN